MRLRQTSLSPSNGLRAAPPPPTHSSSPKQLLKLKLPQHLQLRQQQPRPLQQQLQQLQQPQQPQQKRQLRESLGITNKAVECGHCGVRGGLWAGRSPSLETGRGRCWSR